MGQSAEAEAVPLLQLAHREALAVVVEELLGTMEQFFSRPFLVLRTLAVEAEAGLLVEVLTPRVVLEL